MASASVSRRCKQECTDTAFLWRLAPHPCLWREGFTFGWQKQGQLLHLFLSVFHHRTLGLLLQLGRRVSAGYRSTGATGDGIYLQTAAALQSTPVDGMRAKSASCPESLSSSG